jgi:UPF0755 protein
VKRLLQLVLIASLLAGGYLLYALNRPYAGFSGEKIIELPKGTGAGRIAQILENNGVIAARWQFLAARALYRGATLQAGEYLFKQPASVLEVFHRIVRGDIFYKLLVVPEGKNMFEIAALAGELGYFTPAEFLKIARDPKPVRDLDPRAATLEGYLFPSTYRVNRNTGARGLSRQMTAEFRRVWAGLGTNADVHEIVTLASLVEKEGKLPEERPLIAAVYRNRLNIGMKLDADPTTIYAAILESRYRGTIHKSDLASQNAYNTYKNRGLPPGPIANPGVASLQAALKPANVKYLYFVADPDGSGRHVFSETYEAHGQAVANYRRGGSTP